MEFATQVMGLGIDSRVREANRSVQANRGKDRGTEGRTVELQAYLNSLKAWPAVITSGDTPEAESHSVHCLSPAFLWGTSC